MKGMRRLSIVGLSGILLVFACTRHVDGQEQRAAIEGIVRDAQRAVVPGAAVAAIGASGLRLETITDSAGAYRFAALPPGTYEVAAHLVGFVPARVVGIELALGVQLNIDLQLEPAGPAETLEVLSQSTRVSITQSVRATSIRDHAIERMPIGRDFTSLAAQAPGVNEEPKLAGVSIDGASGAENRVVIDSVDTTNTVHGTPGQLLVPDFVEELQVKSSGYSAEYGGSTGGVLNAITKSGSNAWHGNALLYWSGDALDASPRPTLQLAPDDATRAEYVTYLEDRYTQLEPGFTVGGPLVRDHAWLFAGYVPSFRTVSRSVTFAADATTAAFRQTARQRNAAVNLTAQPDSRWRIKVASSTGWRRQDGLLPALDGSGNPDANYGVADINPNYSVSTTVDLMPGAHAYFSVRAGYFFRNFQNDGVYQGDLFSYQTSSVGMPGVPPEYQHGRLYSNVPSNSGADREQSPHFATQVDGTLVFTRAGLHQVKAGLQFDRVGLDTLTGNTGNVIRIFWGQRFAGTSGPFGYYRVNSNTVLPNRGFITQGAAAVSNLGLFLQDAWSMGPRLTVNIGLRTENEDVPSLSPDPRVPATAIHFGFADKLAPRVGVAWDATGDGRTKVYGSWGVFYDITKLELAFGFGGINWVSYWYTLDSGDIGPIVDNPDCPPACPGRPIGDPVYLTPPLNDPAVDLIDPGIGQMRLQEAVLGIERELSPNLTVSGRYIHKQLDRVVEDIGALDPAHPEVFTIGNPGLGVASEFVPSGATIPVTYPKAARDYDAFEANVDKRLSQGWEARVSYTWSRLRGNYSGLADSDDATPVRPNVARSFDYPLMAFNERGEPVYGALATDRTHQLKANLLYDFSSATSIGARVVGVSGIPRSREAAFIPGRSYAVMYRGRNSDGRLPFLSQLDLYVQQRFSIGGRMRFTVSANIINVFNQSVATNYFPTELFAGQALQVDESDLYSTGIDTQALIAQQQLTRDARFLMTSGFQPPRAVRIAARLGF
jgi:hypothetical protein